MTVEDCRRFFADEVRFAGGPAAPALIEAFARVPREKFLGPGPWQIACLDGLGSGGVGYTATEDPRDVYHNVLIALDASRHINNGQPSALARWINALDLRTGDRVFHVGCGVGYYTAIMAEVVGSGGAVVGVEVDAELAARARQNLSGYPSVTFYEGDGAELDPGVCDAMLINAGVTHPHLPWLDRLAEGGRIVLPLTAAVAGMNAGMGVMVKIAREPNGLSARIISAVGIYSCTTVRDPDLEAPLKNALENRELLKLKSVRRDEHEQTDTCLVHGRNICLSSASLT